MITLTERLYFKLASQRGEGQDEESIFIRLHRRQRRHKRRYRSVRPSKIYATPLRGVLEIIE